MKVRAIRPGYDGYALKRRKVGEVFDLPFTPEEEKRFTSRWLERVDGKPVKTGQKTVQKKEEPADVESASNSEVI